VLGVPSFVVTLGGLMSFRGAAFLVADGKTQPVNDEFFQRLGGGYRRRHRRRRDVGARAGSSRRLSCGCALRRRACAPRMRRAAVARRAGHRAARMVLTLAFAWMMNSYQISSKDRAAGHSDSRC
jgi:D-xylose transport system permease protein